MNRALLILGCSACGRFAFDDAPARSDATIADTSIDARTGPPCATNAIVPDPLTFSGRTYRYTGFDNTHSALPGVMVTVRDTDDTILDSAVSDSSGIYSVDIPAAPRPVRMMYELGGWFTSYVVTDQLLDVPVSGTNANLWALGDAPLWNSVGMVSVYDTVGETRSDTNGTINIAIRTCAGASIAGVTVTVDPTPPAISYTTNDNMPSRIETQLPYSHAVVFNAAAGTNRITATAPGLEFPVIEVDVVPGPTNTLVLLHPYE